MKVTLDISRFDPKTDSKPRRQQYDVNIDPVARVLDALIHISRYVDGTLSFRKSCAHGVCGSDAMRINGVEKLACKTLIREVAKQDGDVIILDPLKHMPIQKDLMVDQSEFLAKFRSVAPYLNPKDAPPAKGEYIQSADERNIIDDPTKCINCGACYSACTILDDNPNFLGPAALMAAARFVFDSRDKGLDARLEIVDRPDAIWACDNHFDCTRVCPREIKITKLINFTKRAVKKYKEGA